MGEIIPHWLEKQAELKPDQQAIRWPGGRSMTFYELRCASRAVAKSLKSYGVKKGTHIAMLADNQEEVPVFVHAASYAGAVLVLLNTRLTAPELAFQLEDGDVEYLFTSETLKEKGLQAVEEAQKDMLLYTLETLPRSTDDGAVHDEFDVEDVYTMMYTSGTTGKPKAVMHTYGNHWHSAIASGLNLGVHADDQWLLCLPIFHVGGFSILMKSVVYGMTVECLSKFDEKVVQEAIVDRGITHVSVVTLMLRKLLDLIGDGSYPEHFRCMLLGGGPVPEHLLQASASRGIPVFQTYGMTETSSQIATLDPSSALRKLGSAGKALSTARLKVDAERETEVGEILVKGPMVAKGYYNRPPLEEGYFGTGDLGYKDEDGYLYVVDRLKDVIISGGENVYPAEVESVLSSSDMVLEAGVTGISDDKWGEVPAAFIVLKEGCVWDAEAMEEFVASRLAKYKQPARYYIVEELPRNASNKLLRRQLLSLVGEE
ncbi:o-succinylbenzoate--CoA ligase [Halobacillus litoralis]|uniref:o-succinylbenzoate--CoA ligase n=1 Tax=Halobacillus litoralis TaxID=45668 RepID=UPI001CD2FCE5|nr:o-succinylbenzoate--CoA ligase [Halobacillus litoralis]MCA0972837.1 o-succinylbenzoate--CoA ligase [Halobacillus litoralis]